jgi:nicotinamidase/pyrazinamidase
MAFVHSAALTRAADATNRANKNSSGDAKPTAIHTNISERTKQKIVELPYEGQKSPAMNSPVQITARDVLLITDVQNDFCPGGALAIPRGDEVVPVINRLASRFANVVLTQDWHPPGHLSFASSHPGMKPFESIWLNDYQQTLWPDHCVQQTHGASFHEALHAPHAQLILRKGFRRELDCYSAFRENDLSTPTGLTAYLVERDLQRVFLAGLAYDYCVRASAVDASAAGFSSFVIEDACRAIDLNGSLEATRKEFSQTGVTHVSSADFF